PTGEAFRAIGEGIAGLENHFQKVNVAMALAGRNGAEIVQAFSSIKKVEEAFAGQSAFKELMDRSAERFHETEVALKRMSENGLKFVAGFLDQVVPMFEETFAGLGAIDMTPLGQKLGALAGVVIQAWRDNKFPEML